MSITRILLDNGADMELLDSGGKTALIIGAGAGYPDIVSELLARGAQKQQVNIRSLGRFDVLSLFAMWHNPESWDERLFQASDEGKTRLVRALLIAGSS